MPPASRKLNVVVVGGGLGGLATGLALQTDGHTVTILDSTMEFAEVRLTLNYSPVVHTHVYTRLILIPFRPALASVCRPTRADSSSAGASTWTI